MLQSKLEGDFEICIFEITLTSLFYFTERRNCIMKDWRTIPSYPDYEASDDGEIRNIKTGRIMKQQTNDRGNYSLQLRKDKRSHTVRASRLVAEAFVPCDEDIAYLDAIHIDSDKSNNRPDNLKWGTRKETARNAFDNGVRRGPRSMGIRIVETGEEFDSIRECARALGNENYQRIIGDCLKRPVHYAYGYHFELI